MAQKKIIHFLFFIIFFAGLLPFLILVFYNHPSADDYLWTAMIMQSSIWDFQVYNFYEWSGRYFSNFLVSLNPLVFHSLFGYQLAALIFLFSFLGAVFYLIRVLTSNIFNNIEQWLGSLIFTVLFLAYTPSPAELFYWFTGAAVYTSASILFLIFIACLFQYYQRSNRQEQTLSLKIIMIVSIVLMMWANEIIIIGLGGLLFLIVCISIYYKHPTRYFLIILLFIAVLSALTSVLAPGNVARAATMFPNKFNIDFTVSETFKKFAQTLIWLKNAPLWIISLFFIPICAKLIKANALFRNHFYIHPIVSFVFWLGILCFAYFPIHLATGLEGIAMRVRATNYLFFILGWFANLFIIVAYLYSRPLFSSFIEKISTTYESFQKRLIFIAIPLLLFFSYKFFSTNSKVGKAWDDLLSSRAKTYDEKMKQRYDLLKNKNTGVPYIEEQPSTLYFADLEENPRDWKNRNCAIYFGVDSIKVIKYSNE
jgi:hypothetical protein